MLFRSTSLFISPDVRGISKSQSDARSDMGLQPVCLSSSTLYLLTHPHAASWWCLLQRTELMQDHPVFTLFLKSESARKAVFLVIAAWPRRLLLDGTENDSHHWVWEGREKWSVVVLWEACRTEQNKAKTSVVAVWLWNDKSSRVQNAQMLLTCTSTKDRWLLVPVKKDFYLINNILQNLRPILNLVFVSGSYEAMLYMNLFYSLSINFN